MGSRRTWIGAALGLAVLTGALGWGSRMASASPPPPASGLLVDRGLPAANLNDPAGPNRSNVRWSAFSGHYNEGFDGDSFTVGNAGTTYLLDRISTWTALGNTKCGDTAFVGNRISDIGLFLGIGTTDTQLVTSASLTVGSDATSNPSITLTRTTYPAPDADGGVLYENFGTYLRMWRVDFTNLNLLVPGGTEIRFGVMGTGRPRVDGQDGCPTGVNGTDHSWYNHASNAALSGSPQQGADNMLIQFFANGAYQMTFNSSDYWDKSSDINVQVYGHQFSKDDCKDGRWQNYRSPSFKNQGDCVSFVATAGKNQPNSPRPTQPGDYPQRDN